MKRAVILLIIVLSAIMTKASTSEVLTDNWIKHVVMLDSLGRDSIVTTSYYDGLGRECQKITVGASPTGADIVSRTVYDSNGLPSIVYLDGLSYGNGTYASEIDYSVYKGDLHPFTSITYDDALNRRMISAIGPGDDSYNKSQETKREYRLNSASSGELQCRRFETNSSPSVGWPFLVRAKGYYAAGDLDVMRQTGVDGEITLTFSNVRGKKVLERRILDGAFLDTYFVYDDADNITAVLPPMAVEEMSNLYGEWESESSPELDRWAYLYVYDVRSRPVMKKLPGQEIIRFLYDGGDRPVLMQDGNMRQRGLWRFTLSDAMGRECLVGTCSGLRRDNNAEIRGERAVVSLRLSDTGSFPPRLTPESVGPLAGYDLVGWTLDSARVTAATYYDNYLPLLLFSEASGSSVALSDKQVLFLYKSFLFDIHPSPIPGGGVEVRPKAKGMKTIEMVLAGESDSADVTLAVTEYDYRYRPKRVVNFDHLGCFDESIIRYDFPGRPKSVVHSRLSADLVELIRETTTYDYDKSGRTLSVTHRLGENDPVEIAQYSYDELGRQQIDTRAGLAELTRLTDYNVRSQPVSITSNLFSQHLSYTPGGRISHIDWSCPDGSGDHSFEFCYDNLSRLTSAIYGTGNPDKSTRYNCDYAYDSHGNLLSIVRKGLGDGGKFSLIDDLTLTYDGNRLIHVKDVASDPTYKDAFSFTDDNIITLGGGNEYAYDANGNIVSDTNKGMSVSYDINNRPKRISRGVNHSIDYLYDARGRKLSQTHITRILLWQPSPLRPGQQQSMRAVTSKTDYCGNIIYRDNEPFQLFFDGGYVSLDEPEPSYRFFLPDHLGSIRAVADTNGQLLQSNHYYPYGMLMGESTGGDLQSRKFGGKELDREGGLDLYDQEARLYDSAIGRFLRPDDSAEKYYSISPYSYCGGNPVNCIDPTGEDIVVLNYTDGLHLAMLIQNEDGKWQYYSVNGNKMRIFGWQLSGRRFNDVAVGSWNSPEEFLHSPYNVRDENSQDDKSKNHFGFEEGYWISTTPEQDEIMRKSFTAIAKTTYNPVANNCATAVQEAMLKAGIPVSKPIMMPSYIPMTTQFGIIDVFDGYKMNCEISIEPSIAFRSIMRWNSGGKYLRK